MLGQATNGLLQKTTFDLLRIVRQLMTSAMLVIRQLQTVQGGGRGQRYSSKLGQQPILPERVALLTGYRQQWIQAQSLVVINILIAQSQTVNALRKQFLHLVIYPTRIPPVVKAASQTPAHPKPSINLPEQQRSSITGEGPARKIRHHFAWPQVLKEQRLILTVCRRRSGGCHRHLAQLFQAS